MPVPAPQYLFVYGTLRRGFGGLMSRWLAGRGRYLGPATLPGELYDLGTYPAFVPSSAREGATVSGDLYALSHPAPVLRKLDCFEGIGPGQSRPYEYSRQLLSVQAADGESLEAWVYVYARPLKGLRRITGGDYLGDTRSRR